MVLEHIKDLDELDLFRYGFWFIHNVGPFDVYTDGIFNIFINVGKGISGTGLQNFWTFADNLKIRDKEVTMEEIQALSAHMALFIEQDLD